MIKLTSYAIFVFLLFGSSFGLYSQDTLPKLNDTTKPAIELPSSGNISLIYSKRFIPNFKPFAENLKIDGNNFYGISSSEDIHLTNMTYLRGDASIELGNMYGNLALYISLVPKIVIGASTTLAVYFGAGPCVLALDESKNLGGFGISSSLGFTLNVYAGLGLTFSYQYENYTKATYNTVNCGINYILK
jgi:hypothetical protein